MGCVPVDGHEHVDVGPLADPGVVGAEDHLVQDSQVEGGEEVPPEHVGVAGVLDVGVLHHGDVAVVVDPVGGLMVPVIRFSPTLMAYKSKFWVPFIVGLLIL